MIARLLCQRRHLPYGRWLVCLCAFFFVCVLFISAVIVEAAGTSTALASQSETLTWDQYWRLVDITQRILTDLAQPDPGDLGPALDVLAEEWQAVKLVVFPDGRSVALDTGPVVSQLRANPPALELLQAELVSWQEFSQSRVEADRSKFAAADLQPLKEILEQKEFQWAVEKPSFLEEWWLKLQQRFWEWFSRSFPENAGAAAGASSLWTWLLAAGGGLLILLALVYVFRGLFADFVTESALETGVGDGDERLSAAGALRRADLFSGEGDYRSAVRYLYLSTLLLLEERALLRYDRSKTNREYLRSIASQPGLASLLGDVIDIFDRVWYGFQPISSQDYHEYARRVQDLQRHEK